MLLQEYARDFSKLLKEAAPSPIEGCEAPAAAMQAALYDMYENLYFCDSISGRDATRSLSGCLAILDAVSRGAELHVYVAAKLLAHVAATQGTDSPAAQVGYVVASCQCLRTLVHPQE